MASRSLAEAAGYQLLSLTGGLPASALVTFVLGSSWGTLVNAGNHNGGDYGLVLQEICPGAMVFRTMRMRIALRIRRGSFFRRPEIAAKTVAR